MTRSPIPWAPPAAIAEHPSAGSAAGGFRAVLWDLDGTLIDTEPVFFEVIAELCASYGHTFAAGDNETLVGRDGAATCAYLMQRFALPLSHDELGQHIGQRFLATVRAEHARPDAVALVRSLAGRAVPQACVSNSPTRLIRHHLALLGLDETIGCSVGRDEVANGKPHPDPYLLACDRLGVPAAACVAVEDTPTGVAAARAAGVTVIACPTPMTAHLDFAAAHHRVERLADFPWASAVLGGSAGHSHNDRND
jgi:HAD superfamily hydrolase (TIGR01509 family)